MTSPAAVLLAVAGTLFSLHGCAARHAQRPPTPLDPRLDTLQQQTLESLHVQRSLVEQLSRLIDDLKTSAATTSQQLTKAQEQGDATNERLASLGVSAEDMNRRLARAENALLEMQRLLETKKEPANTDSPCKIIETGAIDATTRAVVERSRILERLTSAHLVPESAEFRLEHAIKVVCEGMPASLVLVPAVRQPCCTEGYAVYAYNERSKNFGFFARSDGRGRLTIRDERNEGIDVTYGQRGVMRTAAAAPAGSGWHCVAESLRKRVDIKEMMGGGIDAGACVVTGGAWCASLAVRAAVIGGAVLWDCVVEPWVRN